MEKNSRRLNRLQSFFLVLVVSLVGSVGLAGMAIAAAPFVDDFDSYSLGGLAGQGSWAGQGATVENIVTPSGTGQAVGLTGWYPYIGKDGSPLTAGSWFFQFKTNGDAGNVVMGASQSGGEFVNAFITNCDVDHCSIVQEGYSAEFTKSEWHSFGAVWTSVTSFSLYLDNVLIHTYTGKNMYWSGLSSIRIGYGDLTGVDFYVDNLTTDYLPVTPPVIAGYDPILTPTAPVRNTQNMVDFANPITISGTIAIPDDNPHGYDNLKILFYKPNNALAFQTLNIPLGLTGGQSYNYSATTTIPITTAGVNFFKVTYQISGREFAGSSAYNQTIIEPLLPFDITWIKDSANAAPAAIINQANLPFQPAEEDCDSYSGIDGVMCRLGNFIMGAFLPTNDAINQISGTMDALKSKFPMNYAAAISSSFATIAAGVNDTAGFSFEIYGNSGAVDTSFFSQDLGGGVTIGGTLKIILTFLVLMVFLFWGLNYMHRVLPK